MNFKNLITGKFLIGPALAAIIAAGALTGCASDIGPGNGRVPAGATAGQEISAQERGESGGEHAGGREAPEGSGGESGQEGAEGAGGRGEEGSAANTLAPDETFDQVRAGARLIMNYDAASNSFKGTVENTTNNLLTNVRIEVHLSNGTELGPTVPTDLAPGQVATITLPSTPGSFTGWVAHAEVGGGEGAGGEGAGEGPEGAEGSGEGPEGTEGSGGSQEIGEAAMSSPIIPLGQTWNGVLGGLAVSARYDAATQTVHSTVSNTTSGVLCYVQAEPHLKSGTKTVGELGPDVIGHLSPGQQATTSVSVASEPKLAGVSFDGYVVHMEVFDCAGPGPVPHTGGEGAEGSGGEGPEGSGGESGSEGPEASGGGEEGTAANTLAPDETFDQVRSGARLIMNYDAASNSFKGTVENTTNNVLTSVRIEVHLSNGTELGPTVPMNLNPGQVATINLPSTPASFTGWVAHAEVGGGEGAGGAEGAEGAEGSSGEGPEGGSGEGAEGGSSQEIGEAAMSSPITPLGQTWNGVLGGLAISARYDAATQTVHSTVRNTLSETLCYVQAEPHLKSGTKTVGELGPDVIGHLSPGQQATTSISVASEPKLAGVSFDGYVVHMEVFDCAGPGPVPHTGGEGAEGSGGEGPEGGSGEGAEGSGGRGEEGSAANTLAPDETFDQVRAGARLILSYDAASNSFKGTVENTTNSVLTRVRIEVHLSNGTELGPTTPVNLAPGQVATITLPSTPASFTGWVAHAEVGGGEGAGGAEGGESGGEHGNGGGEGGGEHGGGREGGGEHGSGGERGGGG